MRHRHGGAIVELVSRPTMEIQRRQCLQRTTLLNNGKRLDQALQYACCYWDPVIIYNSVRSTRSTGSPIAALRSEDDVYCKQQGGDVPFYLAAVVNNAVNCWVMSCRASKWTRETRCPSKQLTISVRYVLDINRDRQVSRLRGQEEDWGGKGTHTKNTPTNKTIKYTKILCGRNFQL